MLVSKEPTQDSKPITLDDFTGLLIHSYNNHLSSMMGYAELALLECKDEKVGERLNKSLESGITAVHFGKTILASIGRLQVNRTEVNFNAWFKSFIELLQADFEDNELVVENLVPEDIEILTDFSWFTECCVDLIRFLLAFDAKADLTFSSEVESSDNDHRVFIYINSEQVELDENQQEWLFTPFYSSRLLLGEKDIGLAKAHGFFEQIGGSIEWDNESGFTIEVPAVLVS
ncbi:MAG: hypothetical protein COA86_02075 [Kangiella sp.]|nr:MAG: hypothetical protein COA86_02075 [Kangiella sp.]